MSAGPSPHGSAHFVAINRCAAESLMSYTSPTTNAAIATPSMMAGQGAIKRIRMSGVASKAGAADRVAALRRTVTLHSGYGNTAIASISTL
jgi:hypothetical protein